MSHPTQVHLPKGRVLAICPFESHHDAALYPEPCAFDLSRKPLQVGDGTAVVNSVAGACGRVNIVLTCCGPWAGPRSGAGPSSVEMSKCGPECVCQRPTEGPVCVCKPYWVGRSVSTPYWGLQRRRPLLGYFRVRGCPWRLSSWPLYPVWPLFTFPSLSVCRSCFRRGAVPLPGALLRRDGGGADCTARPAPLRRQHEARRQHASRCSGRSSGGCNR